MLRSVLVPRPYTQADVARAPPHDRALEHIAPRFPNYTCEWLARKPRAPKTRYVCIPRCSRVFFRRAPPPCPPRAPFHTPHTPASFQQITLRGSVEVVTEFFGYAINSILYQRGIYPPESFTSVAKYGLSVLVTSDEGLKSYLVQVLRQLAEWLTKGEVQKLVVVITGVESREVLERWVFNIDTDKTALAPGVTRVKAHKEIQGEIQAIIRQVTACVTFLPLLEEACSFDLLVYADTAAKVPAAWEESDPKVRVCGDGGQRPRPPPPPLLPTNCRDTHPPAQYIATSSEVRLRSFTTSIHKVAPTVSFKQAAGV